MERVTFALLVAWDGGPYKGWQKQEGLATVMGVLEGALRRQGIGATPYGASRTDAGVNARAQVVSFATRGELDGGKLTRALNDDLPETIRVLAARKVPRQFHSHWSSVGKIYRYRLSFRGEPRAWRLPDERIHLTSLDPTRLAAALDQLRLAPDLSALTSRVDEGKVRTLRRAELAAHDASGTTLEFEGPAFGKHQIRYLVAAALAHATSEVDDAGLADMLAGRAPRPMRAPAEGLTLHRVLYPPDLDPFPDVDALAR